MMMVCSTYPPCRSLPIASQYDSLHAAACTASQMAPAQRGHIWLLLRAQVHQAAAGAQLQLGGTTCAFVHSQEALKLAGAVYSTVSTAAAPQAEVGGAHGASHDASQKDNSNSGDGTQGAQDLSCLWAAASVYMCSLLQAALVFDSGGCVEDAACLLRECKQLASRMGASGVLAAVATLQAGLALRQQRKDKAQERVDSAHAILMSGESLAKAPVACDPSAWLLICIYTGFCCAINSTPAFPLT
jgi:hypothetical protein